MRNLLEKLQHQTFSLRRTSASTLLKRVSGMLEVFSPPPFQLRLMACKFGLGTLPYPHRRLGTPEYVAAQLESLSTQHGALFARLPDVPDLQVAWLLLFFCALPRAQYVLRVLPPRWTEAFALAPDRSVPTCLAALLRVESSEDFLAQSLTCGRAQLALQHGGLGLRSAAAHAPAACILRVMDRQPAGHCDARPAPVWDRRAPILTRGWQRLASRAVDSQAAASLARRLDASSRALLESQSGPFASQRCLLAPSSRPARTSCRSSLPGSRGDGRYKCPASRSGPCR